MGASAGKNGMYLIGDVAEIVGMSRDALRFYEKKGIIHARKKGKWLQILFGKRHLQTDVYYLSQKDEYQPEGSGGDHGQGQGGHGGFYDGIPVGGGKKGTGRAGKP